jgi:PAS domain S-box-containing protein
MDAPVETRRLEWTNGLIGLLALGLAMGWWWDHRKRLQATNRLNSVNDRLRVLFDESPLSICVFDPNDRDIPFRIVECNQYACDLHGWTRAELIGRGMEILTPLPLTYEGAQHFLARLREGAVRGENPHKRKDGSVFYIEYVARMVVIDGREYMIGVDRDLSADRARRDSEEQLHRSAELNQLVLRASNDGVWDWDTTANRITFSDRNREMLGYTAEELPDDSAAWLALVHPEDEARREDLLHRHWEEGAPYVFQFRARHKDGTWRWIVSRAITLFDAERRPIRMVGCRTDVTEMKRIDAELLQSRKLRAVGEMVGGIAHEFNNLLTPMLLHAEMLALEYDRNALVASHLGPIRIGIDRARELTQRILTFGRRSVDACEFIGLEGVVRDNLNFLAQTIDRRIRITAFPAAVPAVVWANRSDLNQLVVNLVLNARDTLMEKAGSSPPAGWTPQIEILLESVVRPSGAREGTGPQMPQCWRRLTVRDNGLGMTDEVRERVFEPFFTTKTVGQGTGLGLATVWHVSSTLGGWIEVESKAGEGAAFHVFLPAAADNTTVAPSPGAPPAATPIVWSPQAGKRLSVLLVEDCEIVAHATERMIASFGHDVELVTDGRAAWAVLSARAERYDLVFTDLNLPGLSGVELVRRLRGVAYKGRVVVYSGYFSRESEGELIALNVNHLLPKPFGRAQLAPLLE